uniref:isopentenyl-diphosphate Delta-isomerase n=2 Tax=Lutzomyia longipalpis TaxID=7200 RepID=A0A1B0GLS6_LUTLO
MLRRGLKNLQQIGRSYSHQVNVATSPERQQQLALMNDSCMLVNANDKVIGKASKSDCHLVDTYGKVKLHRGFSVYLFNSQGDLVIHRRSKHKITYPNFVTNTCCSHPLHDIEEEREEKDAIGVRKAARRQLNRELGIPLDQIKLEDLNYVMRLYYHDAGNDIWGEHEIAYMFVMQKDVDIKPNPSEIDEIYYIKRENYHRDILEMDAPLTPWFALILKHRLANWWDNLGNLEKCTDHSIQSFYPK